MAYLARGRSATEGLFESRELAAIIDRWAGETTYDRVLAYCSSMGRYAEVGPLKRVPCVIDLVDVDSQKWFDYATGAFGAARWLYRLEGRRVRKLERELAERAQAMTVVSAAEADLLRQFCPRAIVEVVPNGVDLDYFEPQSGEIVAQAARDAAVPHFEFIFVGALDYPPNIDGLIWFSRQVWPQICAHFPAATFSIVGRRPVWRVRRLARQDGIQLVGEVADVRPYLRRARVVVVPLRIARGIQNKVLEALAAGKPLIGSSRALEGLELIPNRHVYRADTAAEWINHIGKLLSDENRGRELAAAGQSFVRRHHPWPKCLQPLERCLGMPQRSQADVLIGA
jgi:sugar transferase (PEP-CTERM/EpsH1 system associated)